MDSYKKLIGQRIAKRRIEMGFTTQSQLAEALDIDTSRVSNYETGKNSPKGKLLKKVLKVLGMKESDLLSLAEEKNPQPKITEMDPRDIGRLYLEARVENERLKTQVVSPLLAAFEKAAPSIQKGILSLLQLPESAFQKTPAPRVPPKNKKGSPGSA